MKIFTITLLLLLGMSINLFGQSNISLRVLTVEVKISSGEFTKAQESFKKDFAANSILQSISIVKSNVTTRKWIINSVMTPPNPLTDEQVKEIKKIVSAKYPQAIFQVVTGNEAQELFK